MEYIHGHGMHKYRRSMNGGSDGVGMELIIKGEESESVPQSMRMTWACHVAFCR